MPQLHVVASLDEAKVSPPSDQARRAYFVGWLAQYSYMMTASAVRYVHESRVVWSKSERIDFG